MSTRKSVRAGLSALLATALIASGALLTAPAASATEASGDASASEQSAPEVKTTPEAPAPEPETTEPAPESEPTEPAPEPESEPAEEPAQAEEPEQTEGSEQAETPKVQSKSDAPKKARAAAASLPESLEPVRDGGGSLSWGFKESWLTYLSSPWTAGTQTTYGGATEADGSVQYPESTASTFDAETQEGVIAYTGGVQWESAAHEFTIAMQNIRIDVAADGSATISAETSTSDTAGSSSVARVVIAEAADIGDVVAGDGMLAWSGVESVFADTIAPDGISRYAGAAADAMSFTTPGEPAEETLEPVRGGGGSLSWGFKASWAGYLDLMGSRTPYGGATKVDGVMQYPESTASTFDADTQQGVIAYTGGVEWKNPAHGINIAMQNIRIDVAADGSATVSAEMSTSDTSGASSVARVVIAEAADIGHVVAGDGMLAWSGVESVFADTIAPGGISRYAGDAADAMSFTTPGTGEGPSGPQVSVSPATGLSDGDTVTVTGSGFNPDQGVYVTTCTDVPLEDVDFNFINDECKGGSAWVMSHGTEAKYPGTFEFEADGSFEVKLDVVQYGESTAVYTIADRHAKDDRSQDAKAVISFASDGGDDDDSDPEPNPGAKVTGKVAKVTPGKTLDVKVTASDLPSGIREAYVGVIEKGTESSLSQDDPYPAMEPFAKVTNGKLSETLSVDPANVNRNKQYEVLIWKQHSAPNASTIYGRADITISNANWDRLFSVKPQKPKAPKAAERGGSQQAGSLRWGVSSQFADYTTNKNRAGGRSGGKILTSGVGGGSGAYVFPQAAGGNWDAGSQTGTVRYSGVVTFTAHGGAMNVSFANPVITVSSDSRGTITAGGYSFGLNLASGSKSVGANGEVTWSGVPLSGSISGGGGGGGGAFGADPVTFTVGAASGVNYGSTSVEAGTSEREAAATPPATTGINVLTDEEDIVPGGEIEFVAPGFESNERDILVVLYSDPIVLDKSAGANADGTVRWIGTIPEDIDLGEHTMTLQGEQYDAGAVIEVVDPEETEDLAAVSSTDTSGPVAATVTSAEPIAGVPMWVWWASALALLVVAGGSSALLIAQRRKN